MKSGPRCLRHFERIDPVQTRRTRIAGAMLRTTIVRIKERRANIVFHFLKVCG